MNITRRQILLAGVGGAAILTSVAVSERERTRRRSAAEDSVASLEYPVLAAHRGGAFVLPENTLHAFDTVTARHPGICLELDVRALGDGTLVVFHDDTIDRLAADASTGTLSQLTAADWSTLQIKSPIGARPAPATTFAQVLQRFGGTQTVLVVELKDKAAAKPFINAVLEHRKQIIVQSFDLEIVERFVAAGLSTLQLAAEEKPDVVPGVHSVGVKWDKITATTVTVVHNAGARLWAWGDGVKVGDKRLLDAGVDALMVDNPDA